MCVRDRENEAVRGDLAYLVSPRERVLTVSSTNFLLDGVVSEEETSASNLARCLGWRNSLP